MKSAADSTTPPMNQLTKPNTRPRRQHHHLADAQLGTTCEQVSGAAKGVGPLMSDPLPHFGAGTCHSRNEGNPVAPKKLQFIRLPRDVVESLIRIGGTGERGFRRISKFLLPIGAGGTTPEVRDAQPAKRLKKAHRAVARA